MTAFLEVVQAVLVGFVSVFFGSLRREAEVSGTFFGSSWRPAELSNG